MSRIIIITGKGGVGKSSVAAAHAVASAAQGQKTLLVSTDMAHNIADLFGQPVGAQVTELDTNLYGLELDPDRIMREEFPDMNRSIGALFSESLGSGKKDGDDMMFPGFDDLFSLLKIGKIQKSGEYDRIIVDCAPTGETLSLLKLPELLSWYMEKFFPVGKSMVRILAPISKYRYHIVLPSSEGMGDIERLHARLVELQNLLKNSEICSVRLVSTPEKMVVEETKRNYMYMHLYGYVVDGLFINRILPEKLDNPFFHRWKVLQKEYIEELESVFGHLPVHKIPWFEREIRGKEAVKHLSFCLFLEEGADLFENHAHTENEVYELVNGECRLILQIPGIKEEEWKVSCHGMDLDLSVHNFQRRIPLPNALRGSHIQRIDLDGDRLLLTFGKAEDSAGITLEEKEGLS